MAEQYPWPTCPHCSGPLDPQEASDACEHCGGNISRPPTSERDSTDEGYEERILDAEMAAAEGEAIDADNAEEAKSRAKLYAAFCQGGRL